ncbi:hypothetical protein B0H16DRAFT_1339028, partial [Mycena metata]
QIRADNCQHPISGGNLQQPCASCRTVPYSDSFQNFTARSEEAAEHTPWDCLTAQQHKSLLAKTRVELMKLRTQYNASYHLASEHSNDNNTLPVIPRHMMVDIFIRKQEASQLGVTAKFTEQFRREERIPDSDAIDIMMLGSSSPARQRQRAETGSTVSSSDAHENKKTKTKGR